MAIVSSTSTAMIQSESRLCMARGALCGASAVCVCLLFDFFPMAARSLDCADADLHCTSEDHRSSRQQAETHRGIRRPGEQQYTGRIRCEDEESPGMGRAWPDAGVR